MENALKSSKYTQLPMVYATSTMSYAIALICPNMSNLKALASSLGVNPLWTISALAERSVAIMAAERGWALHLHDAPPVELTRPEADAPLPDW